jgi:hypothetical protein
MIALGAVTVYLAKADIDNGTDALITSGFAGAVSGAVGAAVAMVCLIVLVILSEYPDTAAFTVWKFGGVGLFGLFCCAPALIVTGILLSVFGGYVFYELAVKRSV